MPRPIRCRRVRARPSVNFFKPAGARLRELKEVVLSVEEYEALRLVDFEEINQVDACDKMQISQPTLSRLLSSARKKVSQAIVKGMAIKIEGGNYKIGG